MRLLVRIMEKCGFAGVEVLAQRGMGPDWLRLYPIFSREFLEMMFGLLPEERHEDTILAVFLRGRKRKASL